MHSAGTQAPGGPYTRSLGKVCGQSQGAKPAGYERDQQGLSWGVRAIQRGVYLFSMPVVTKCHKLGAGL